MSSHWIQDQWGNLVRVDDARAIRVYELVDGASQRTHGIFVEYSADDDVCLFEGDEADCKSFLETIMKSLERT